MITAKEWALVLEDQLLECEFEKSGSHVSTSGPDPKFDFQGFDRLFGEETPQKPDRGSTIEVKIYATHVLVQWITSWFRPPEGYPTYSYPLPEYALEVMGRVYQLIELAKHKEKTGKTSPVPMVLP